MPKKLDLTGQRFGRLAVIESCGSDGSRYQSWLCKCDCGNEIHANTRNLIRGTISSCGCKPGKRRGRRPATEDLTGRTYARLTVMYRCTDTDMGNLWHCKCSCGNEIDVTRRDLVSSRRKSCGCLKRKSLKARPAEQNI